MERYSDGDGYGDWREEDRPVNDDAICVCGHKLYLHDDGKDDCLDCICKCFVEESK